MASVHDPTSFMLYQLFGVGALAHRGLPPVRGFVREVPLAFPALHLFARKGCPGHCGTLDKPGGNSGFQDALRHGIQWSSASVGALSLGTHKDLGHQVGQPRGLLVPYALWNTFSFKLVSNSVQFDLFDIIKTVPRTPVACGRVTGIGPFAQVRLKRFASGCEDATGVLLAPLVNEFVVITFLNP